MSPALEVPLTEVQEGECGEMGWVEAEGDGILSVEPAHEVGALDSGAPLAHGVRFSIARDGKVLHLCLSHAEARRLSEHVEALCGPEWKKVAES